MTDTAQSDIISVMQTPLASLSSVSSSHIVYINTPYAPTEGVPHLQVYMLFSEPSQASLGNLGWEYYGGIMQIDVHVPVGEGRASLNTIMEELRTVYKRGTTLTNDNISVKCKRAWESTPYNGRGWYVVPLNVSWYAYTLNE